jgi:putative transposase
VGLAGGATANCAPSGVKVAALTVWDVLKEAGIDPAPERSTDSHSTSLRTHAGAVLAADLFETPHVDRRPALRPGRHRARQAPGTQPRRHPCTAAWVTQATRNLMTDLHDAGCRARFPIRDRDGKDPALVTAVLTDVGIRVVRTGVPVPRTSSLMKKVSPQLPQTSCPTAC